MPTPEVTPVNKLPSSGEVETLANPTELTAGETETAAEQKKKSAPAAYGSALVPQALKTSSNMDTVKLNGDDQLMSMETPPEELDRI